MVKVKPFKGLRPNKEYAEKVASPPYDVLSSDEAREMAKDNPYSFLHVNKPEIDLDETVDPYDVRVYRRGAENLKKLIDHGILEQDQEEYFYIYQQIMGDHKQTGLVAGASCDEYIQDKIKKHEHTRPDKEEDRMTHINILNAQVGPVFLTYKSKPEIDEIFKEGMQNEPEYDFVADGVRHTFWVVKDKDLINKIQKAFNKIDYLYVADGHHRSASATRVKREREKKNPNHTGDEEYNYFLTVIFPDNQMQILDYNRIVKDLNGLSTEEFLSKIKEKFDVELSAEDEPFKPAKKHEFGMYLENNWYKLTPKKDTFDEKDVVERLDVSILQNNLLSPILGIENPRKDKRIDFVGGIRGLKELEKRVDSGDWKVAFSMYPTTIGDLMNIADAGKVMPPKSTWFEPKLRSGLVVHLLD